MCPVCWATALATYTALLAASAVAVAGADRWSLTSAAVLGSLSAGHWAEWIAAPWWCLAALAAALAVRIGYLVIVAKDRLLIAHVWRLALATAQRHCPRKAS